MKKKRWKLGIWLLLILLLTGGAFAYYKKKNEKEGGPSYKAVTATLGQLDLTVLSTGIVQPQNRLEIKPPISGRIEEILVQEGQKVKSGQILGWMSSTERAALLDAARSKGSEELKRWKDMYRPTPILAPINGTVILKNVEPGQTFTSSDAVLVLSDRLTVKAQVDETDLSQIKLGQRARIVLDAYPEGGIEGKVDKLAFEAVTTNNVTTYTTDVVPLETPDFMRSGMTANVTFYTESRSEVLLAPTEAIQSEDGETFVYVPAAEAKGKPQKRPVKLGLSDGKQTEISEGLSKGETILIVEDALDSGKSGGGNPFSPFGGGRPRGGGGANRGAGGR